MLTWVTTFLDRAGQSAAHAIVAIVLILAAAVVVVRLAIIAAQGPKELGAAIMLIVRPVVHELTKPHQTLKERINFAVFLLAAFATILSLLSALAENVVGQVLGNDLEASAAALAMCFFAASVAIAYACARVCDRHSAEIRQAKARQRRRR